MVETGALSLKHQICKNSDSLESGTIVSVPAFDIIGYSAVGVAMQGYNADAESLGWHGSKRAGRNRQIRREKQKPQDQLCLRLNNVLMELARDRKTFCHLRVSR